MFRHPMVAPADESADRRRSGVENVDAIFFDDFPEAIGLRPVRYALVHNSRCAIRERTINNITVSGYPADVGGAPKNVFVTNVEHVFHGRVNADEITARRMQNSFRFSRGTTRVKKIKRILAADRWRRPACMAALQIPTPSANPVSCHTNSSSTQ